MAHWPQLMMSSAGSPARLACRWPSQSPAMMAAAIRTPYHRMTTGPIWNAIAPGELNIRARIARHSAALRVDGTSRPTHTRRDGTPPVHRRAPRSLPGGLLAGTVQRRIQRPSPAGPAASRAPADQQRDRPRPATRTTTVTAGGGRRPPSEVPRIRDSPLTAGRRSRRVAASRPGGAADPAKHRAPLSRTRSPGTMRDPPGPRRPWGHRRPAPRAPRG